MTYNILLGGARREALIQDVLTLVDADVVALQEVTNIPFVRELARALRMRLLLGEPSDPASFHLAILTRRPVRSWRNQRHAGVMLRSHLHCDIDTGSERTPVIGIHDVHLAARFGERAKGEARRMRELTAIMDDIGRAHHREHIVLGDFNALSPGDRVAATAFFQRYNALRRAGLLVQQAGGYIGPRPRRRDDDDEELDARWRAAGVDPRLDVGVPHLPRVVGRLTSRVPVNAATDRFLGRFIERWTAERMQQLGYVDCYRTLHPRGRGFTSATWMPAARVDYVFATPELAQSLIECNVVGPREHPDRDALVASDHFPVVAEFRL